MESGSLGALWASTTKEAGSEKFQEVKDLALCGSVEHVRMIVRALHTVSFLFDCFQLSFCCEYQ